MKRRILLVCTANICRSPMAQALLADKVSRAGDGERFQVESAGTWGLDDEPASGLARATMRARGLDLETHRARTVTAELLRQADLVLVMANDHKDALAAEFPFVRRKLHLVSELAGLHYDIGDPYGKTAAAYESCARELAQLIENGYPRFGEWLASIRTADGPQAGEKSGTQELSL